jgi:hypothetical protein
MSNSYVFTSLPPATACQVAVDAHLGMPLAGTDIGLGVHAPASESRTTTYAQVLPHPTVAGSYIYPADGVTTSILSVGPTAATLPAPVPTPTAAVAVL